MGEQGAFSFTEHQESDGSVRVRLVGELDADGAPSAQAALRRLEHAGSDVLLDLSDLAFMDVFGLHVIEEAADAARRGGFGFSIVGPVSPAVRGVFDAAGAGHHLPGGQAHLAAAVPGAPQHQSSDERAVDGAHPDQTASDSDQTGSDLDRRSREERERTARDRQQTADVRAQVSHARDATAASRDATARARDAVAAERDAVADIRDLAAYGRDRLADAGDRSRDSEQIARRTRGDRKRAQSNREQAARDREGAAEDRKQAAHDREQAAHDLEEAAHDLRRTDSQGTTGP